MQKLKLAYRSLSNRSFAVSLTVASLAVSTFLIIGIFKLSSNIKQSFMQTISGTDLIVGARTSPNNLLLFSVFDIGSPTQSITGTSYATFAYRKEIAWSFPWVMGDSHKGYRVIGTNNDCFEHFQFGNKQHLHFKSGGPFSQPEQVILGASIANDLGYKKGDRITLAHGRGKHSFHNHNDYNLTISGILTQTGTAIDASLFTTTQALEEIHKELEHHNQDPLFPNTGIKNKKYSTFFIGLKNRSQALQLQQTINSYKEEALTAILPAMTLIGLWQSLSIIETTLLLISAMVLVASLIGMVAMLLSLLNERRREIAIYRSLGARMKDITFLMLLETFSISFIGVSVGYLLLFAAILMVKSQTFIHIAYPLPLSYFNQLDFVYYPTLIVTSTLFGIIPAIKATKNALHDGLKIKS